MKKIEITEKGEVERELGQLMATTLRLEEDLNLVAGMSEE